MTLLTYGTQQPCDRAQMLAPRRRRPCPQRDKPWVLATAILGSSLAFIEGSAVNLALPDVQAGLQITFTGVQWVVNAYLLVLGAFMLTGGALGDRFGLRRILMAGNAVFALGALGCALAPSLSLLVVARCVQGLGGALLVPASLALIGSHFNEEERGRAIGIWAGASALTTAIGPVLGGWLVDLWGWTSVFYLVVPLALLTMVIAAWRVPADSTEPDGPLDYVGALLLAGALATLIYAIVDPGAPWRRYLFLSLSVLSAAAFLRREYLFSHPVLPLQLFRSRSFSGANLVTLLLYAALSGALYFLPFNLIQVQGYSATQAGAAFLPMTLMLGIGSIFAGDLIRRFDPRVVLTAGPVIAAMGFFALALPGACASFVAGFLPAILAIGLGMTINVAPLTTVVLNSVAERQAGVASGINNTVARLAGVIAVAILTSVAISSFSAGLDSSLRQAGVPQPVLERLLPDAARLAGLRPPADVSAASADLINAAISMAYIGTFRLMVSLCGVLALAGALIAWIGLRGLNRNSGDDSAV